MIGHDMLVNLLKAEYQTRVTIGSQYNKFLSGTEQYIYKIYFIFTGQCGIQIRPCDNDRYLC